jgi:hypothetical protein
MGNVVNGRLKEKGEGGKTIKMESKKANICKYRKHLVSLTNAVPIRIPQFQTWKGGIWILDKKIVPLEKPPT